MKIKFSILIKLVLLVLAITLSVLVLKTNEVVLNSEIDRVAVITNYVVLNNHQKYYDIFANIFDEAKLCNNEKCRSDISLKLHNNLVDMKPTMFYEGMYFIRANKSGKIDKLFLSGEYKEKEIETKLESKVFKFISNNNQDLYLKGIRVDGGYSNMKYLKDFYSEAEIVIPVRTYDDMRIIGAIVKGYGD